jgi:hypothetical protein
MAALKKFFESQGGRTVTSRELIDFKNACSGEEYEAYIKSAQEQLARQEIL